MATWPTSPASTANLDAGTDRPSLARPDLKTNVDNVNAIIDMFNITSPSNGNILKYSSSTTKFELTADADVNTTYSISAETASGGANLRLTGSDASTDDVKIASGTGITVSRTDANTITIASSISDTNTTYAISAITDGADANIRLTGSDSTIDDIQLIAGTNITLAVTSAGAIQINNSASSGIASVSADTTPSLGGDLNVNGKSIVSTSSGNITLAPNNSGNIFLTPNTGYIKLAAVKWPAGAGTNNYVLQTNGTDQASWTAQSVAISTGVTGLGTSVATALAVNVGSSGAVVVNGGALGTPSSGTLTNATGLPVGTGISGLGTGVATFLATPSSANLISAVTDETGSGSLVFATSPTLVTPVLGTPTSGTLTNCTVDGTNSIGYRKAPAVGTKTGSYTLAVGDVGKYVQVGSGGSITIPDATFAEGDIISIVNNHTAAITITCTITTAYISGTDTDKATVSLATRGLCSIIFLSGTVCVIAGSVS
jgi:hypothetical protein